MQQHVRVAIVQTKPRKGRYAENLDEVRDIFAQLAAEPAPELIVFPEAALTGYFLEGAVYELARPAEAFAADLAQAWKAAAGRKRVDLVCGFFENASGTYYNSALYLECEGGEHRIAHVHRKMFLPTYGVFDEERFLSRGRRLQVFGTQFGTIALLICEDVWHALMPTIAAIKGAHLLIVPSAHRAAASKRTTNSEASAAGAKFFMQRLPSTAFTSCTRASRVSKAEKA